MTIGKSAIAAMFVLAAPAAAQTAVTASTDGKFTQVFAGPGDTAPVYSGLGTSGISFGTGDPSTLYYAGANGDFADRYTPPAPFFLGSIYYHNGAITTTSGISAVTLSLITTLSEPVNPAGDGIGLLDELIYITNTPNSSDPAASADYITFASLAVGAYVYEGQSAIFNLMGTLNSPLTLSEIVLVSDPTTGFVAAAPPFTNPITSVGQVPEPATWVSMIGGFAMIGGAIRYRRRQRVSFAAAA
jgi:hypothetical protein